MTSPLPRCPPQVSMLQGKRRTWYAGAFTLFNTHEIATMSGEAGSPWPWPGLGEPMRCSFSADGRASHIGHASHAHLPATASASRQPTLRAFLPRVGLAVAERLGAPYPFAHDSLATQQVGSRAANATQGRLVEEG